jgi:hypothetical protein
MLRRFISTLGLAFATGLVCAQGVTDSQVLLGQSVALTGPAQQLGLDMQQGAKPLFRRGQLARRRAWPQDRPEDAGRRL